MTAPQGAPPLAASPGKRRLLLAIAVLVVLGAAGAIVYAYAHASTQPPTGQPSLMQATCSSVSNSGTPQVSNVTGGGSGAHAYFLIVEGDYPSPYAGLNGSAYVPANDTWPTMEVKVGQVVSIHVINCAASEPHGFQIAYYDDIQQNGHSNLITVPAGQSYDVTFTATKQGTFRVYCGILCTIHPLMQNGALVVT